MCRSSYSVVLPDQWVALSYTRPPSSTTPLEKTSRHRSSYPINEIGLFRRPNEGRHSLLLLVAWAVMAATIRGGRLSAKTISTPPPHGGPLRDLPERAIEHTNLSDCFLLLRRPLIRIFVARGELAVATLPKPPRRLISRPRFDHPRPRSSAKSYLDEDDRAP